MSWPVCAIGGLMRHFGANITADPTIAVPATSGSNTHTQTDVALRSLRKSANGPSVALPNVNSLLNEFDAGGAE